MNTIAKLGTTVLLTAVIFGMMSSAASATDSLWKGSVQGTTAPYQEEGVADLSKDYANHDTCFGWGGGQLGNFTADGGHTIYPDLRIRGQATWVCSDGPSLFVTYEGNVVITEDPDFPYLFTAVLTANGGTGYLANATGSANMNGKFSGTLREFYFDFDGTLDTKGNFHEFGIIELESLDCAKGQTVPYTMDAWRPITGQGSHTGSIMPTSEPVIDESIPGMTIWRFSAEQGPNPRYYDMPVHVMAMKDGMVFCRFEAQCRLEIDHHNDGAATLWFDGLFTVMGGTGRYEDARGSWQTMFATEPCFGDDPNWCVYVSNGTFQLDQFQTNATAKILFNRTK